MAHGTRTRAISGELISGSMSDPVTSSEQVWDYSQTDSQNKPRTQEAINAEALGKQDRLVSGTNIKTINNNSLLGSGNITISNVSGAGTLNTTTSSTLSVQSSESLGGSVSLHRVSKTGKYTDLVFGGTGMNQKVIKAGTSLSTQMNQEDTIYIIQDDVNISNYTVTVPSGCVLKFEGGKIYSSIAGGGTLVGQNTKIDAGLEQIFGTGVTVSGTWNVPEAYPEWFGAGLGNIVGYNDGGVALTDDTAAIQAAVTAFDYVKLTKKYAITTVTVPQFHTVENSATYVIDGDGYHMDMRSTITGGLIEVSSSKDYIIENQKVKLRNGNSYQEVAYKDYNNFIKNVPAAITIGSASSSGRRVMVSKVKITVGDIYDANSVEIAGGSKSTYIVAGIKTAMDKTGSIYNAFMMFTDVDIYGLFYGIVGNLRGSRFDVCIEQCYDNIDIYGGMNIFNLNGQTGVRLNLNPNGDPIYDFDYFVYLQGSSNVINDGIYDIGSKAANQQYLINETGRNIINSYLKEYYRNALANNTNGDYRSDLSFTWLGSYRHDYKIDGIQYTATLENGTYSKSGIQTADVSDIDFFNPSYYITFTPDANKTMTLTLLFEKIKNPFGVAVFAQSNGYNFKNMEIHYTKTTSLSGKTILLNGTSVTVTSSTVIPVGSTIVLYPGTSSEATYYIDGTDTLISGTNLVVWSLVANVAQGAYPTLAWDADYYQYQLYGQESMKVVLTHNEAVRYYGMCVYAKTSQNITSGPTSSRPTKGLYVGQSYFDTDLYPARPVFWNGASWSDLTSVVELPTAQYIDYFDPDQGSDYKSVTIPSKGITVQCYPNGDFTFTGTCTSPGGRDVALSNVFTLEPGTYTLTREMIEGTPEDFMAYLMDVDGGETPAVTNFNEGRKTITLEEQKRCYIAINFLNEGLTYNKTVRLKVATFATFGLAGVIEDILWRLDQLEGN